MSDQQDAIIIHGLTKTFGSKVAVNNLDLRIPAGSLCGFIGPNGAGKTTTIRMIMSIIFPDKGQLSVLGKPSAIESKDRIGYLPEERGVYKKMKVGAFLSYMAKLKGVDPGSAKKKTAQWLEKVGLGDVAKKKCEELSKGMQQKVQFIAAVIHEPDLLILDEVFSGLDPMNRVLMRGLIDEQHRRGCTIVFSTHAMYEAEQLCDRVFMIHKGVKVLDDTLDAIREKFDPKTISFQPINRTMDMTEILRIPGVADVKADVLAKRADTFHARLAESAVASDVLSRIAAAGPMRRVEQKFSLDDVFMQMVNASGMETLTREQLLAEANEEAAHV